MAAFAFDPRNSSTIVYQRVDYLIDPYSSSQSCKSGRVFRVGFGFGPGSGLKLTKISGLIRAWDVLFVLSAQKYNQNNLATLLNFSDLT